MKTSAEMQLEEGFVYFRQARASLERAIECWERAAEQGDANAQNNLATFYVIGLGVPRDVKRATELWELAVAQGNAGAQYNLSNFYSDGRDVASDPKRARELLELSAKQGFEAAVTKLSRASTYTPAYADAKRQSSAAPAGESKDQKKGVLRA